MGLKEIVAAAEQKLSDARDAVVSKLSTVIHSAEARDTALAIEAHAAAAAELAVNTLISSKLGPLSGLVMPAIESGEKALETKIEQATSNAMGGQNAPSIAASDPVAASIVAALDQAAEKYGADAVKAALAKFGSPK